MPRLTRVSTLEPCQCRVLPCPARSRSKGVPTAQISASMPRLPRQKLTLSKDLYPSPPEHPTLRKTPSQALRRHPRSSHGVCGLPIRDISCAVLGALDFLSFLQSPELLILTLLPLPFAWHLPIDERGNLFSTEVVKKGMSRSQLGVNIQCLGRYTTAKPLRTAPKTSESYPSASSVSGQTLGAFGHCGNK